MWLRVFRNQFAYRHGGGGLLPRARRTEYVKVHIAHPPACIFDPCRSIICRRDNEHI